MILPEINVLVCAYRREAVDHDAYAAWLTSLVAGQDELALADHCLTGFLHIVTNPRIFSDPAPPPRHSPLSTGCAEPTAAVR